MDDVVIYPLFSCPLYVSQVGDFNIEKTLIKLENESFSNTNDGSGRNTTDNNILRRRKYSDEYKVILRHLEKYIHDVLSINKNLKIDITQSWSVRQSEGNFISDHIHTNSSFSGVLYVKCDPHSGNIVFSMPMSHPTYCTSSMCYNDDIVESNFLNSNKWWIEPKVGNIIIFPSHVQHKVEKSSSQYDRYSIAFNCVLRGNIGSSSYSSNLTL